MKKTAAMFLMILAFVLVVGGNVCVAADNPDATKILMGFVKENLSAKQMSVKQVDEIRSLLDQGANVNAVDANGVTLLIAASYNGQVEIVRLLLAKGAQVDKAEGSGFTPLHIASQQGHTEIVKLLLANGAQADKATKDGNTALFLACLQGRTDVGV